MIGSISSVAKWVALSLLLLCVGCESTSETRNSGPSFLDMYQLVDVTVNYEEIQEPLHVASLEKEYRKKQPGINVLKNLGKNLGFLEDPKERKAVSEGINRHIIPHVRDQLSPLFKGTNPARVEVDLKSVFLRSKAGELLISGSVEVTLSGVRSPDQSQLIAGLTIYDAEARFPIRTITPVTLHDEYGRVISLERTGKPVVYGSSKRLNELAFRYADIMAKAIRNNATSSDFDISGDDGFVTRF